MPSQSFTSRTYAFTRIQEQEPLAQRTWYSEFYSHCLKSETGRSAWCSRGWNVESAEAMAALRQHAGPLRRGPHQFVTRLTPPKLSNYPVTKIVSPCCSEHRKALKWRGLATCSVELRRQLQFSDVLRGLSICVRTIVNTSSCNKFVTWPFANYPFPGGKSAAGASRWPLTPI
jgi:hypothetical protein